MRVRQAAGGGRVVEVAPQRLPGWLTRFADRNGGIVSMRSGLTGTIVMAGDGTRAELAAPFPPMRPDGEGVEPLLDHIASLPPTAIVLVRAGAYSIGVVESGAVTVSKTGTRYVQGRTAAGGWSQQRFARRRGNQRRQGLRAAIETAQRVLGPHLERIGAVVVGGEMGAVTELLADPRLARLSTLPRRSFPDIPAPRRAVLDEIAQRSRTIEITIRDAPAADAEGAPEH